jgi:N-acetylglucosaminyl-diphospho-decaprenol L-rhamnosyltransferase
VNPLDVVESGSRPHPRGPLVTAVVVNYNAWPDVSALVGALAASPEVAAGLCEVVVVDNASEGPVPPLLRSPRPGIRLISREDNGGFAVGVNAGWKAARSPWLLLLNPDVVAGDGLLARVVERLGRFEADPDRSGPPGIVGFALLNPDGTPQPSVGTFPNLGRTIWEQLIPRSRRKYQAIWRTRAGPVAWVTGACMLVNAAMLELVGGLDEEFFLYYEEVALCRAAARKGWRVEYDPSVEVVHLRPLQNRPVTPGMRVITRHSKLLYFRKHLPRWQFLGLCAVVAAEARVRGAWARARGRDEEARAWRTVARVERALRRGAALGGRDVRILADAVAQPSPEPGPGKGPAPRRRTLRQGR